MAEEFGKGAILDHDIMSRKEFSSRLYKLMVERGLRQADLVRALGISRSTASAYVTGRNFPSDENLQALAKLLKVTPDKLVPIRGTQLRMYDDTLRFVMTTSDNNPNHVRVQMNRWVTAEAAQQIWALVNAHSVEPD